MKTVVSIVLSAFLLAIPLSGQALLKKKSPEEKRQKLQDHRKVALDKLYAEKPSTREELKSAKGYAVFSSLGINVLLVSTENGGGILRWISSRKQAGISRVRRMPTRKHQPRAGEQKLPAARCPGPRYTS